MAKVAFVGFGEVNTPIDIIVKIENPISGNKTNKKATLSSFANSLDLFLFILTITVSFAFITNYLFIIYPFLRLNHLIPFGMLLHKLLDVVLLFLNLHK